jgi:hypothetical protein
MTATSDYVFCYERKSGITPNTMTKGDSIDAGVDINAPDGTVLLAVGDGKVHKATPNPGGFGNYWICLELDKPVTTTINGVREVQKFVFYGHCGQSEFSDGGNQSTIGKQVKAGDKIARVGEGHVEIGWAQDSSGNPRHGRDPNGGTWGRGTNPSGLSMFGWLQHQTSTVEGTDTGPGTVTDSGISSSGLTVSQASIATSFTGYFSFGGLFNGAESQSLRGSRAMMNDVPLMPFVEQLAGASLRHFMSLPNGQFYAFYPDYFGSLGKQAYWQIADIEIINGRIDFSDDELATHVFVVGDHTSNPDGQIDIHDQLTTGGIVTIFNAFSADFLNGTPDNGASADSNTKATFSDRNAAIAFLNKYGARPMYHPEPLIRAPVYEAFLAYQLFCLQWAKQFKVIFEFTFMPELYPGGLIEFPEHGLRCYVNSVTHNCSYEHGFTTSAELMAPSAMKDDSGSAINKNKSWVHAGMIRAIDYKDVVNFNPTTNPLSGNRKEWKPGKI